MILILSKPTDAHAAIVVRRLESAGAPYAQLDPGEFPSMAHLTLRSGSAGFTQRSISQGGRRLDLDAVTAVWLRRPGLPDMEKSVPEQYRAGGRDAAASALWGWWETLDCLWVPGKPSADRLASLKVKQLSLATRLGFEVPQTLITNSPEEFLDFYERLEGRVVTKPLGFSPLTRDGEKYQCFTRPVRRRDLARYQCVRYAPLILQEYVTKRLEFRVTVVDSQVFAAAIDSQASASTKHDWRHYDDPRVTTKPFILPSAVEERCVRLVREMNLHFGAIDLVLRPDGRYVFLEINPNGQWAWMGEVSESIAMAITALLMRGSRAHFTTVPAAERLHAVSI